MKKFWREYSIYFTSPSGNLQKIFMFWMADIGQMRVEYQRQVAFLHWINYNILE